MFGKSRSQKRAEGRLGVVQPRKTMPYRSTELDKIDKYLESTQYDHLSDWDVSECSGSYIKIKDRKPAIIYPMAQVLTDRLASKLLGMSVFPSPKIEGDPDTEEFLKIIMRATHFKDKLLQAMKPFVSKGSVFVRFKIVEGKPIIQHYNPKYCYPKFDKKNDLVQVEIKYVYEDWEDLDVKGFPIKKWYRMVVGKNSDVLYNSPKYEDRIEPIFNTVATVEHNLGFVQGVWMKTVDDEHSPDGPGVVKPIMDFSDALNYNLSQSDKSVAYGQDPQLVTNGMDSEEVDDLVKSSSRAWNLGREGDAKFLEVAGSGVTVAKEFRTDIKKDIMDIARIIILDPEKIVGSAQSGKAMEVLHGPMIELINELRPQVDKGLIELDQKLMLALIVFNDKGAKLTITIPEGYSPVSMDIVNTWPEIFPKTMQDLRDKIGVATSMTSGNLASRESMLRWVAKDFNIENIEEEMQKVDTQKEFNTFGF